MAVDPAQVEAAQEALEPVRNEWMNRHGVTSIEVARLWDGDTATDDVCIRVTVEKLLDPADVRPGERFPHHLGDTRIQMRQASAPSLE